MAVLRYVVIGLAIAYLLVELLDIFVGVAEMIGAQDAERVAARTRNPSSRSRTAADRTRLGASGHKDGKERPAKPATSGESETQETSTNRDSKPASSDKERFAASQALLLAVDQNDIPTLRTLLKSGVLDVNHENAQGGALFRLCNRPGGDDPKSLQMLELLLSHPQIEVNGNQRSWPPLKAALARHNQEQARLLLKHPKIRPFVQVSGLGCDVLRHTPNGVVYVYDAEDPECFKHHRDALAVRDYALKHGPGAPKLQFEVKTPQPEAPRQSSQQPKLTDFGPDSPVMNPTLYPSLLVLFWAYFVGMSVPVSAVTFAALCWFVVNAILVTTSLLCILAPKRREADDIPAAPRPQPQPAAPNPAPQ